MTLWIESRLRLAPQGKKVLCFDNGDIDVRQRFKSFWIPMPYTDSKFANLDQPEFWQEISFPSGYKGYMQVFIEGELLFMDEYEKKHPELFESVVKTMLDHYKSTRNG